MSMMSEISTTPYDGASVSYLGDWDAPSALVVNNSVGGDVAVDQSMATTSTQGGETRSEDWTMDASLGLADGLSALSLNAFSVSTLGGGNGNEAILNGAERPHEAPRPTISAPRFTGNIYPTAATRPEVSTPETSNTTGSRESLRPDNPLLADVMDAIHRALDGDIGEDKVRELIAKAMRASSNDDDTKPAAREGTRVRTESDSRMESIAEEMDQPMGSVPDSSSVSVPHNSNSSDFEPHPFNANITGTMQDSSDFEPHPFNANVTGTMQDYSMDQMGQNSSATFQDSVARMPSVNGSVQHNGFMYEPPGSGHPHAHSPNGDTAALSYYHQQATGQHQHGHGHHLRPMVSTERYESNHNDLSVYPNLLQPTADAAFARPVAAVSQPLVSFNVVKITNRAPSEVGAHGEIDASLVSAADDSHGDIAIYLFDAGLVGSSMFYQEFKRHHVSYARARNQAEKGKIHPKLMANITISSKGLAGKLLKPATLGGVVEMNYLETSNALEVFLEQKCYVDCDRNLDVLMGRGGHTSYPGNQRFLDKRDEMRAAYVTESNSDAKTKMSQDLVDWVYANGGRFVTQGDDNGSDNSSGSKANGSNGYASKGKTSKGNGRWYIVENRDARRKARQALTELRSLRPTV